MYVVDLNNQCHKARNLTMTVHTAWDVMGYTERQSTRLDGLNVEKEAAILKEYPPLYTPSTALDCPLIVMDRHGKILLWYLCGCLTIERHVGFINNIWY
jgi:hypothetical protein